MLELFDGIYGQEPVKEILYRFLIHKSKPQALLFTGAWGVGKEFMAIRFANLINSMKTPDSLPAIAKDSIQGDRFMFICPLPVGKNETSADDPYEKLSNSEIELIQEQFRIKEENPYHKIKIPKANDIKISSIRALNKFTSLTVGPDLYRFVIVSQAHLMNEPAQNSLLKNLEEPPEGTIFILTTSEPEMLRETIRSRCWHVEFRPLSEKNVSDILSKYYSIEEEEARLLGKLSEGSLKKALFIRDKNISETRSEIIKFLRYSLAGKIRVAQSVLKDYTADGDNDLFRLFFTLVIHWFSDYKRFLAGFTDGFFFESNIDVFEKFSVNFPGIEPIKAISSIERILYYVENNNVNPGIAGYNIIFLLASVIKEEFAKQKIYIN